MAKNTPRELYEQRDMDEVFTREVIAGLLRILNRKLVYQQNWSDDGEPEKVTVPFFFDFGEHNNSERFIQDNYIFFGDSGCSDIGIKKIDGNFDIYPRGAISLASTTIDSGNITNRFVLGKYNKRIGDTLQSFVSFLYSIPLSYSFNIEIRTKTYISMMKIEEAFRKFFYKNKTFYINYHGSKVPCRAGFAESFSNTDKGASYTMGSQDSEKFFKQTMSIAVETYQPVYDPTTEMLYENTIKGFTTSIHVDGSDDKSQDRIWFVNNLSGMTFSSLTKVFLEWRYSYSHRDADSGFNIALIDEETGESSIIAENVKELFYDWTTPEDSRLSSPIDVIIPNTEECNVYQQPVIKILPDPVSKAVTPESVKVYSKGFFLTDNPVVECFISYMMKGGKMQDVPMQIKLLNSQIDLDENPMFKSFVYQNDISKKTWTVRVSDARYPEIYAEITNISIM